MYRLLESDDVIEKQDEFLATDYNWYDGINSIGVKVSQAGIHYIWRRKIQKQKCPIGLHDVKANISTKILTENEAELFYEAIKKSYNYMCEHLGHTPHA